MSSFPSNNNSEVRLTHSDPIKSTPLSEAERENLASQSRDRIKAAIEKGQDTLYGSDVQVKGETESAPLPDFRETFPKRRDKIIQSLKAARSVRGKIN